MRFIYAFISIVMSVVGVQLVRVTARLSRTFRQKQILTLCNRNSLYINIFNHQLHKYSVRDEYVIIQPRCLRGTAAQALRLVFTPGTAEIDPSPKASTAAKLPARAAPWQSSC